MAVLLQINNLRKRYGAQSIFEDASVALLASQKIGVIGRNGSGKSTLCKIITGQEEMDGGTIARNSGLRLSYLEQHDPFGPEETVLEFLTRYTGQEEWRCGEIAGRFRLKNEILDTKVSKLPGGFQTRVKLTAMLLKEPNFLVLDEPSNYLDLSTLILLENFLQSFNGGFMIVSHDREFLKRTCEHTLEAERGRLFLYPGAIEEYLAFKEEQLRHKIAYNKQIEKKREQLQEFIDRFKAKASHATQAKSKMKQLSRLTTIEIEHALASVVIKIPQVEGKKGTALLCEDLAIGYPEKIVATAISMDIERGTHVAVLGDNGQGKTTFFKTISGQLEPKSGHFQWGSELKMAYYAQHVLHMLHPQDTVFSHLRRMAPADVLNQDILNMAGCFLFKGDDVEKKVGVLSGGEKARLCLAGLLLTRSQVLLLDEPTNHLDFETVEALGRALKEFNGTVFFISHDRTFVNMVANNIIEVRDGAIRKYPGSYEDFVYHLEMEAREGMPDSEIEKLTEEKQNGSGEPAAENAAEEISEPQKTEQPGGAGTVADDKILDKTERRKIKADISKLKSQIAKLELRLDNLVQERDAILEDIRKNPFHFSRQRNERLKKITIVIEEEEALWEELQEELEELKKRVN